MLSATCPQCGQASKLLFFTKDYNRHISNESFQYDRCPACGLIFLDSIPSNLRDYYPQSYYIFPSSIQEFAPQVKSQAYKVDLVKQFVSKGRLLEIGPGPGDFAYLAKTAGFDVNVIEMDARCCDFLRDVIGVNVVHSAETIDVLRTMDKYDVIAMWQVIEHLSNPWTVLNALSKHLASGGILLIAAPNPESFQFRVWGHRWTHLDAPRHIELIPSALITQRLEDQGLTSVLATTTDKGSLGWNAFGWQFGLSNLIRRRLQMQTVGRILAGFLAPIERTGWRGSTYTLIFQKE